MKILNVLVFTFTSCSHVLVIRVCNLSRKKDGKCRIAVKKLELDLFSAPALDSSSHTRSLPRGFFLISRTTRRE